MTRKHKVLAVDDDKDILDLLKYNLEKEGYSVKVLQDSRKALKVATEFLPDLVILDIMMPHPNGIEICRELRSSMDFAETYIFFLTAKSEYYFQQAALDTGGDDFIQKVVGLRSLTYKIGAVLKKKFIIRKSLTELHVGNLRIKRKSQTVNIGEGEVSLSRPEFELLFFFAQNPGKVISQENLLHNLWGSEVYLSENSIEVHIKNLINKIGSSIIRRVKEDRYRLDIR